LTTNGSQFAEECFGCSALCDKAINHEGRWFYECHTLTGDLSKYDSISIVWNEIGWWQVHAGTAEGYIDMPVRLSDVGDHDYMGAIDYQETISGSVCIDPNEFPYELDGTGISGYFNNLKSGGKLRCFDKPDWVFRCSLYKCFLIMNCF